jgi:type II restriction/modification system DNA methylase subunit YeeA
VEAAWPEAEFIVGNPPFLGTKKLIGELGANYAETIRSIFDGRVSRFSDLVCWWFEKARAQIASGKAERAGLVATNSIRGGKNRIALERVATDLSIFEAWSDEPWVVEGAAVRVSIICFAETKEPKMLDGTAVASINSDLTAGTNLPLAKRLGENHGTSFVGTVKAGKFDVPGDLARSWLRAPINPNGRPNSDVVRPWYNTLDVVREQRDSWVVDFDETPKMDAAFYGDPFQHVTREVKPKREKVRRKTYREHWWQFAEPCTAMKQAVARTGSRYVATPTVAKHRVFVWLASGIQADHQLVAIARDDDTVFGILHSRFHEAWSLRLGTSLEDRPRYTPTTTFETYPFPEGLTPNIPATSYADDPRAQRVAAAATTLDEKRRAWLNPANLVDIVPEIVPTAAPGEAPVKYPDRIVPKSDEAAAALKKRTLTKLYNERPQWLQDLHDTLDRAVAAAYGWPEDISTEAALERLLALNLERSAGGR